MGHLINPISTRLGLNSFWISSWSKYKIDKFYYDLSLDNVTRNFILWLFSDSRVSAQLSIVGIFLSHFKIIRRSRSIAVSVFLILNSSKFLKSQSVEVDPINATHRSEVAQVRNICMYNSLSKTFFKQYHFANVKDIFSSFVSKLLADNLNYYFKFNSFFCRYTLGLDLVFVKKPRFVNARFLSRFISRRLSFGFELNKVLHPIALDLIGLVTRVSSKLYGFKIACSGRFNKTQMASYTWEKYGPVCLNTFSSSIDYSFSKVFLRYGLCGIKVWLFSSHLPFKSYKSNYLRTFLNKNINNSVFIRPFLNKKLFLSSWVYQLLKFFHIDEVVKNCQVGYQDLEQQDNFLFFLKSFVLLTSSFKK